MKYKHVDKQSIRIDKRYLPIEWTKKLVAGQKIGGVYLVFLDGKDQKEINFKVKSLNKFCKELKNKYETNKTNN